MDRAGCRARQYDTVPATRRAYIRIVPGHAAHHPSDRRVIRSVSDTHVLGVSAYASTVTSPPMACATHLACMAHKHRPYPSWRISSAGSDLHSHTAPAVSLRPNPSSVLNQSNSPYTVSVYPIEQEPGVWFATYLISEYREGTERILANVSMRHNVHGTEALAKNAARLAGRAAIARLAPRYRN